MKQSLKLINREVGRNCVSCFMERIKKNYSENAAAPFIRYSVKIYKGINFNMNICLKYLKFDRYTNIPTYFLIVLIYRTHLRKY